MQLPIRAKNLTKIMAKEPGRYSAMHYAKLDGDKLVATDGRRLVVLPVERDEHDTDGFVTREAIAAAAKFKGRNGTTSISANGDLRTLNFVQPRPTDGSFPAYTRAVPTFKPGDEHTVTVAFNARYLAEIADCLGDDDCAQITIKLGYQPPTKYVDGKRVEQPLDYTKPDGGPLLISSPNGTGVLMPIAIP